MSNIAALDALAEGAADDVVTVTVPEGRSRREVKRGLPPGLEGDYVVPTRRSPLLDPARLRREGRDRAWRAFCSPPPTS